MKTTIDIPETLLHQAKIVAAQRKTTLKDLILQGLHQALRSPQGATEHERKAALKRLLGRMKASNSKPMSPLRREEIYDR